MNVAIWLDEERDRWAVELVDLAHGWSCFNNTSCFAELLEVMVPAAV